MIKYFTFFCFAVVASAIDAPHYSDSMLQQTRFWLQGVLSSLEKEVVVLGVAANSTHKKLLNRPDDYVQNTTDHLYKDLNAKRIQFQALEEMTTAKNTLECRNLIKNLGSKASDVENSMMECTYEQSAASDKVFLSIIQFVKAELENLKEDGKSAGQCNTVKCLKKIGFDAIWRSHIPIKVGLAQLKHILAVSDTSEKLCISKQFNDYKLLSSRFFNDTESCMDGRVQTEAYVEQ